MVWFGIPRDKDRRHLTRPCNLGRDIIPEGAKAVLSEWRKSPRASRACGATISVHVGAGFKTAPTARIDARRPSSTPRPPAFVQLRLLSGPRIFHHGPHA